MSTSIRRGRDALEIRIDQTGGARAAASCGSPLAVNRRATRTRSSRAETLTASGLLMNERMSSRGPIDRQPASDLAPGSLRSKCSNVCCDPSQTAKGLSPVFDVRDAAACHLSPARRGATPTAIGRWRRQAAAAAMAAALAGVFRIALFRGGSAQDKPPAKVVLSLDFNPLGRHAPWYAALAEGYFKHEGLDVSIIPSQGTAQTIQAVESGIANIAFVDVPSVVLARGERLQAQDGRGRTIRRRPMRSSASATAATSRSRASSEGLTLGSGAGSFTPKVIAGSMAQKGLDPAKLTIGKYRAAGTRRRAAVATGAGNRIFHHGQARTGGAAPRRPTPSCARCC